MKKQLLSTALLLSTICCAMDNNNNCANDKKRKREIPITGQMPADDFGIENRKQKKRKRRDRFQSPLGKRIKK